MPTYQHPFPLNLKQTALLVIDMQNAFCSQDGFCRNELRADLASLRRAIIPAIRRMLHWSRKHRLLVIYTRESHVPDLSDVIPSKKLRYINAGYPIATPGKMGRFLIQGELGAQLIDQLQPLDTELQTNKPAQSVFVCTDLASVPHQRGIT